MVSWHWTHTTDQSNGSCDQKWTWWSDNHNFGESSSIPRNGPCNATNNQWNDSEWNGVTVGHLNELSRLCLWWLNQSNDWLIFRIFSFFGNLHLYCDVTVDGTWHQVVAWFLSYRNGFTSQWRLVKTRSTLDDFTVNRNLLTWLDQNDVANVQFINLDFSNLTVNQLVGNTWCIVQKRTEFLAGLSSSVVFQCFTTSGHYQNHPFSPVVVDQNSRNNRNNC